MRQTTIRGGAVFALALMLLVPAAAASDETKPDEERPQVALTGVLSGDDVRGYFLIEEGSGDSIRLWGTDDLARHVDSRVRVRGQWNTDDAGDRYFEVSTCEALSPHAEDE